MLLKKGVGVGKVQCVDEVTPMSPLNLEQNTNCTNPPCVVRNMSNSDSVKLPTGIEVDLPDFSHDQTELVKNLLAEFEDMFSRGEFDLGCTNLVQLYIEISFSKPVLKRPRRLAVHGKLKYKKRLMISLNVVLYSPLKSP